MKTRFMIIGCMVLALSWVVDAVASPIGDPTETGSHFLYGDDTLTSSLANGRGVTRDIDIWEGLTPYDDFTKELSDRGQKEEGEKIPITAFLFSHGRYIHGWDLPYFEAWTLRGFFPQRPFEYKGPLPDPRYAFGPESRRYEYPYGYTSRYIYIPPFDKYILFAEISRYGYPYIPIGPKGRPAPGLVGAGYQYPYGGPQMKGVPAEEAYKYGRPLPGGLSPEVREREIEKRKLEGKEGELAQFREEVAVSRAAGKPYGMILFGAGLTSLAAVFRMFRLSLVIMVVWLTFYGPAIWRIIVDLV